MQKSDIKPLFKKNWLLALHVAFMNEDALSHIKLLNPDSTETDPKYKNFCDQLKIPDKPWVLVVDNDYTDTLMKGLDGGYRPALNLIILPQKTYEEFTNNANKHSEYIVAHEIGHKKDRLTRRQWLRTTGLFLGSLTAGKAVEQTTNFLAKNIGANDTISNIARWTAMIAATNKTIEFGYKMGIRQNEFSADQYAAVLVGYKDCINAIYNNFPIEIKEMYGELKPQYLEMMKEGLAEKNITLTQEQLERGFPIYLANMLPERKISLRDIIKDGAYPHTMERIRHLTDHPPQENAIR